MTDYKNLSKSAFNVQANTYDVDKTGKHARGQYKYVLNELQQLDFQKNLRCWMWYRGNIKKH